MLAHCVFMSFFMYWHNRRLSFQSSCNRRQNSDFSFSVSSNSNGKSSERTVLCVYYGTTADADVSHCESSVNHPMSWLLLNMLFFVGGCKQVWGGHPDLHSTAEQDHQAGVVGGFAAGDGLFPAWRRQRARNFGYYHSESTQAQTHRALRPSVGWGFCPIIIT